MPRPAVSRGSQGNSRLGEKTDARRAPVKKMAAMTSRRPSENESMAKLLLIEDDKETADEIRAELGDRGFDSTGRRTASKGWTRHAPAAQTP